MQEFHVFLVRFEERLEFLSAICHNLRHSKRSLLHFSCYIFIKNHQKNTLKPFFIFFLIVINSPTSLKSLFTSKWLQDQKSKVTRKSLLIKTVEPIKICLNESTFLVRIWMRVMKQFFIFFFDSVPCFLEKFGEFLRRFFFSSNCTS